MLHARRIRLHMNTHFPSSFTPPHKSRSTHLCQCLSRKSPAGLEQGTRGERGGEKGKQQKACAGVSNAHNLADKRASNISPQHQMYLRKCAHACACAVPHRRRPSPSPGTRARNRHLGRSGPPFDQGCRRHRNRGLGSSRPRHRLSCAHAQGNTNDKLKLRAYGAQSANCNCLFRRVGR